MGTEEQWPVRHVGNNKGFESWRQSEKKQEFISTTRNHSPDVSTS
jgi:hypothetical protein